MNHGRGWLPPSLGGLNIQAGLIWEKARAAQERRRAAHAARKQARAKREGTRAERAQAATLAQWPELAALLAPGYDPPSEFLEDMQRALQKGAMTDRQAEAACTAIERDRERERRRAERAAAEAEARAQGVTVPTGRQTFSGVITAVQEEADRYSYQALPVYRICIRHADGWRVWGSLPRGMAPKTPHDLEGPLTDEQSERLWDSGKGWCDRLSGRQVTIRATLVPGKRDPLAGGFKRPVLVSCSPDRENARVLAEIQGGDGPAPDIKSAAVSAPVAAPSAAPVRGSVAAGWAGLIAAVRCAAPESEAPALVPLTWADLQKRVTLTC